MSYLSWKFGILDKIKILRIIKAIWKTCIVIPSLLIDPPFPVIGLSGILVITQISTKITVPAIPIEYQILPHFLIIGTI